MKLMLFFNRRLAQMAADEFGFILPGVERVDLNALQQIKRLEVKPFDWLRALSLPNGPLHLPLLRQISAY
jgi:hypothetical protein